MFIGIFAMLFITSCRYVELSGVPECTNKQLPVDCISAINTYYFKNVNLTTALCKYQTEFHDTFVCFKDLNNPEPRKTFQDKEYCYTVPSTQRFCDVIIYPNGENESVNCREIMVQNIVCHPRGIKVVKNVKI